MRAAPILLATVLAGSTPAAPTAQDHSGLPVIGPAPDFVLRAQDGAEVTLNQFRGKAVAVTFIFASCSATCPILTAKMASVQTELGSDFGSKIAFLSITIDPEHDTPDVLQRYARTFGADPGHRTSLRRVRVKIVGPRGGPHESDFAGRSAWHAARAISRCALRSGRVAPRSSG